MHRPRRNLQPPCVALAEVTIFGPSLPQGAPVNKQEIVNAVAKRLGVTRARAAEITALVF